MNENTSKALFVLIGLVLFMGFLTYRGNIEYTQEELDDAKAYILSNIDNETLCEDLHYEADYLLNNGESISSLNEYMYTVYILQEFNAAMKERGVGLYLYNTQCEYVEELEKCFISLKLGEFAKEYKDLFRKSAINKDDFATVDFWEEDSKLSELYDIYPFEEFDKRFNQINQNNLLTNTIAEYARTNIDQFNYGKLWKQQLEATADKLRTRNN